MVWYFGYGSIGFFEIFGVVVGPPGTDPLLVVLLHIVVATHLRHSINGLLERDTIIRTKIGLHFHRGVAISKVDVP